MTEPRCAGVQPWFPWPLSRWPWWTESVPAERVAALRVATALVLLLDIGAGYLPHFTSFFAPEVAGLNLYEGRFRADHGLWSALRWLPPGWGPAAVFGVWIGSALALLVGWRPLVSGLLAWACAVSVWNFNPWLHNGGDRLRHTLFLVVALSSSGAVWGVSSVRRTGRAAGRANSSDGAARAREDAAGRANSSDGAARALEDDPRPVLVPGWPVKILFVQLAALYFFSGYYKVLSPLWRNGFVMYWASHDLAWSLCPGAADLLPVWAHRVSALVTLIWELGFPVLAVMKRTRVATLALGVLFHLGTLFTLEVGAFALYSIACYTAFVPWEKLRRPAG